MHTTNNNVDLILLSNKLFVEQHVRSLHIAINLLTAYNKQPRHSLVDSRLKKSIIHHIDDDTYARTIQQCLKNLLLTTLARTTPDNWRIEDELFLLLKMMLYSK